MDPHRVENAVRHPNLYRRPGLSEILELLRQALVGKFGDNLIEAYVHGSYAKPGQARPTSDLDVIIVLQSFGHSCVP